MCDAAPFTITGNDFTGALYIQQNNTESKVYICLFTCATSRAIHLEIVTDLSTETFLLALRRIASHKSLPWIVVSDNGSTYLSAAEELKELLQSEQLMASLNRHGVLWKFIPKQGPWYGEWWERLIGLTKMLLKKVLSRVHILLPVLETLIVEIEAILNDHPLTYTLSDANDLEPLTPSHLLYGRRKTLVPYENVEDDEVDDPNFGDISNIKHSQGTSTTPQTLQVKVETWVPHIFQRIPCHIWNQSAKGQSGWHSFSSWWLSLETGSHRRVDCGSWRHGMCCAH